MAILDAPGKARFNREWLDLMPQGRISLSTAGFNDPRLDLAVHQPICMVFVYFGGLNGGYDMT